MSTLKLFWDDPYQTRCESVITHVAEEIVMLDRTIAFARSGGQASDEGTIAGFPILEARKNGLDIEYVLPVEHGLAPGDVVDVEIDWGRRFRLMRLHFAAEIVLELVTRLLPTARKIGANIEPDKARIDFAYEGNIAESFEAIFSALEALVAEDRPIASEFSDKLAEIRYWQIDGFARVPCGGTHPRSTGEVGRLALKRANPGRGKERIEIYIAED